MPRNILFAIHEKNKHLIRTKRLCNRLQWWVVIFDVNMYICSFNHGACCKTPFFKNKNAICSNSQQQLQQKKNTASILARRNFLKWYTFNENFNIWSFHLLNLNSLTHIFHGGTRANFELPCNFVKLMQFVDLSLGFISVCIVDIFESISLLNQYLDAEFFFLLVILFSSMQNQWRSILHTFSWTAGFMECVNTLHIDHQKWNLFAWPKVSWL